LKALAGWVLVLGAGCSGFEAPTPALLSGLPLRRESDPRPSRIRFQMSMDSPWLAGEFEGVAVSGRGPSGPQLRAQVFGDLGPKMADLTVRADRVVGYFPQTREGIDCALPGEASPHPLLFMGASLAEELLRQESVPDVIGVREETDGAWLLLRPLVPGMEVQLFLSRGNPEARKRRYTWMWGVSWEEEWTSSSEVRISAPNLSMHVRILDRAETGPAGPSLKAPGLPEDVRIVAGSRK